MEHQEYKGNGIAAGLIAAGLGNLGKNLGKQESNHDLYYEKMRQKMESLLPLDDKSEAIGELMAKVADNLQFFSAAYRKLDNKALAGYAIDIAIDDVILELQKVKKALRK